MYVVLDPCAGRAIQFAIRRGDVPMKEITITCSDILSSFLMCIDVCCRIGRRNEAPQRMTPMNKIENNISRKSAQRSIHPLRGDTRNSVP